MAGGTFNKLIGKELPGTYINVISEDRSIAKIGARGIVVIPLFNHNYGPVGEFIKINSSAVDKEISKLGYSIYDNDQNRQMLLIRSAFKNASTVYVYRINDGTRAQVTKEGLLMKARYKGTRGNSFSVASVANPNGGFDVQVYVDGKRKTVYEKLTNMSDLAFVKDPYVEFAGSGTLKAFAVSNLAGGTDIPAANENITTFLDALEQIRFNTLAFFSSDPALQGAAKNKMKHLIENVGRFVQVVIANSSAKNYRGVINITNSIKLDGISLTPAEACAWYAGATAAATKIESLTEREIDGASEVIGIKSHEEAEKAVRNGETFFSISEAGKVVVAYDINSLTDFEPPSRKDFRKNRVLRVLSDLQEALKLNIPPNRFGNHDDDWDAIEGLGKSIFMLFEDEKAIKNVDYDNDFKVDRDESTGDELYLNINVQPVDSAEKIFITMKIK